MKLSANGREGHVRARIRDDGYDVETLRRAVDGYFGREWNVEKGQIDLALICRNQHQVELGLTRFKENGGPERQEPGSRREALDAIDRGGRGE